MSADYKAWYTNGWRAALHSTDLGTAESRFLDRSGEPWNGDAHHAFEDGWLDYAAGREKWHPRDCADHDNCADANRSMCTGMMPPKNDPAYPWGPGGKFIESGLEPVEDDTID